MTDFSSIEGYLRSKLQEKLASTKEFLVGGQAKDYAEYRHLCGLIRGLEAAEDIINDLAKRHEDADD